MKNSPAPVTTVATPKVRKYFLAAPPTMLAQAKPTARAVTISDPWGYHGIGEEVVEADRDVHLEELSDPEDGEREEDEGDEGDGVVEAAVLAQRRRHADRDAEQDREHRCRDDELHGLADADADLGRDLLALDVVAEVDVAREALEDSSEPDEVAQEGRDVEVQLLAPSPR